MRLRSFLLGAVLGAGTILALAPAVAADTCCANRAVTFTPASAMPGDIVRIDRIVCRTADNAGPLELNLVSFWLSTDDIPASNPGDVPGSPDVHLANDLPRPGKWHPFASVSDPGVATAGSATIVVPKRPPGTYQLWWLCDNDGGPGSGIHYSGGPRLSVGLPDTATAVMPAVPARDSRPATLLLIVVGIAAAFLSLRRRQVRHPADTRRSRSAG